MLLEGRLELRRNAWPWQWGKKLSARWEWQWVAYINRSLMFTPENVLFKLKYFPFLLLFQTNEKGQVVTKTSLLKQMEELIEEPGLTCCICREGYKFQVCFPTNYFPFYCRLLWCSASSYFVLHSLPKFWASTHLRSVWPLRSLRTNPASSRVTALSHTLT